MVKGPAPDRPNEEVMIGLQLEDGPRLERKVKRGLSETGLKLQAWDLFDWPQGPLYVHIVSSRGETEFAFRVEPQWTYILRTQPPKIIRNERDHRNERDERREPKGEQREPRREKGQTVLQLGAKRNITGWCGTKTVTLTVSEKTRKCELIDRITEQMGEPKGSYSMEVRDRGGALRNEFKIAEGWSYKVTRLSPPGTPEAADQELRRRGNESRVLLNRSSVTAMREEELARGDEVRKQRTVSLRCTKDGMRPQTVDVKGDTLPNDVARIIMERYGMTGWGYLEVRQSGRAMDDFLISENVEYRLSAQKTPKSLTCGFMEDRRATGQVAARASGTSGTALADEERGRLG
jgi:hypothetical protein